MGATISAILTPLMPPEEDEAGVVEGEVEEPDCAVAPGSLAVDVGMVEAKGSTDCEAEGAGESSENVALEPEPAPSEAVEKMYSVTKASSVQPSA